MRWAGAASLFVALQLCVAATLALFVGFFHPPPLLKYLGTASLPVMLYGAGFALHVLHRDRPDSPIRHLLALDWRPVLGFAGAMVLMWLQFVTLSWMKAMIPMATSMWADAPLANFEAWLFGADAWRLLPAPSYWIETPYLLWGLFLALSFTIVYFSKWERRDACLLAFFLTVGLLGVFGQYLLPSGGPIFYERLGLGDRFSDIAVPRRTAYLASYLWSAFEGQYINFATGISAFPSIHVATTAWAALSLRHWLAYAYLGMIFVGSVALGWHYAIDGIAGAAGAVMCYALAKRVLAAKLSFSAEVRNAKV